DAETTGAGGVTASAQACVPQATNRTKTPVRAEILFVVFFIWPSVTERSPPSEPNFRLPLWPSVQQTPLQRVVRHRASRLFTHRLQIVITAGRAFWFAANGLARTEQVGIGWYVGVALTHFERPGGLGALNRLQIADARGSLSLLSGLHQIGNRDGGEERDDRDHDHDLHQRESMKSNSSN